MSAPGIEVFTGAGRGKTTAALGVALRASGQGLRVHIVFFMKGGSDYGEQKILARLPNITTARFGQSRLVNARAVAPEDKEEAAQALAEAHRAALSDSYDLVILDEVNVALAWGLIPLGGVLSLLREKPEEVELILTGRGAPREIIEAADLVTEMVEVKHPYSRGTPARRGLDY
ncbi:MAG: cob(I)yrinic acid a,c-diamide adenosyltransferase [Chloroflexi bacterium]|nr:cob(I)yrinic acid a,c-diamide adenosyltransferase [Chloroflexota bacterium]